MRVFAKQLLGRVAPAVLTCVVVAGALFALPAGADTPSTSISGTVTAASSGLGISGICVNAFPNDGGIGTSATTATDGTYTISGLTPGSYDVDFEPGCGGGDYERQWYNATPSGSATSLGAVEVLTALNSPATDISASMSVGTAISGSVTTASSDSDVSGVCASVYSVNSPDAVSSEAVTGTDGNYTVEGLAPGSYYVQFYTSDPACDGGGDYAGQWYNGTTSGASSETEASQVTAPATGIDAVLAAGTSISGG